VGWPDAAWAGHFQILPSGKILFLLVAMSLADFLGRELISGLAGLDSSQLFGAWAGGNPSEVRKRAHFNPVLYREDHVHPHQEFCHLIT
jgi:hypothetical protein